ncbi:hypothetical protein FJY71_10025 [candidate division WOR-3 bacterium]|nr:hypothetical protein [candidate division WOR-3 bacterium]
MIRLFSRVAVLAAAWALLAPPAGAVDNNFFNWSTFRRFDYDATPTGDPWGLFYGRRIAFQESTAALSPRDSNSRWCGHLLVGPPGHQDPALPYCELMVGAIVDTGASALPNRDTVDVRVDWRWVTWFPGDPATKYYGPWRQAVRVTRPWALTWGTVWRGDTLGWFNDVQFRLVGLTANDSSWAYVGVCRRIWK